MNESALKFIGLLRAANELKIASDAIKLTKAHNAHLLVVACDASKLTQNNAEALSLNYHVPLIKCSSKDQLGHYLGINEVALFAIKSKKAALKLSNLIEKEEI